MPKRRVALIQPGSAGVTTYDSGTLRKADGSIVYQSDLTLHPSHGKIGASAKRGADNINVNQQKASKDGTKALTSNYKIGFLNSIQGFDLPDEV